MCIVYNIANFRPKSEICMSCYRKVQKSKRSMTASDSHLTTMNEEWQHMFGGTAESHTQHRLSDNGTV